MSFLGAIGNVISGAAGSLAPVAGSLIPGVGPIGGALISGALSGISNGISQSQANAETERLQRLSFEHQEKMLERQYQMQLETMRMQNEYNSPTNQAQMYRDAGINPFFALGNGAAGVAQSGTGSAPSVPGSSAGSFAGFTPDYANNMAQSVLNKKAIDSQANLNDVTAANDTARTRAQVTLDAANAGLIEKKAAGQQIQNDLARLDFDVANETKEDRIETIKAGRRISVTQADMAEVDLLAAEFNLKAMPVRFKNELAINYATIKNLSASTSQLRALANLHVQETENAKVYKRVLESNADEAFWAAHLAKDTAVDFKKLMKLHGWTDEQAKQYVDAFIDSAVAGAGIAGQENDWYIANRGMDMFKDLVFAFLFFRGAGMGSSKGAAPTLRSKTYTRPDGSRVTERYNKPK